MSDKSKIEWTDASWNPIRGCSRESDGCKNCYAEVQALRIQRLERGRGVAEGKGAYDGLIGRFGQWNGTIRLVPEKLDEPLHWRRPRRIFVNSMSDLFHEQVPFEFVAAVFGVMAAASWHTFQVLTKRPARALEFFRWIDAHPERKDFDTERLTAAHPNDDWRVYFLLQKAAELLGTAGEGQRVEAKGQWPLPNVWMGVSVEDQAAADKRISLLTNIPAAVRWISAEPLLEQVNLNLAMCLDCHAWVTPKLVNNDKDYGCPVCNHIVTRCSSSNRPGRFHEKRSIDWVVAGGESGDDARPMHAAWARSLRDQCAAAGVSFLFKQWGAWSPTEPVAGGDLGAEMRSDVVRIVKPFGENDGHFRRGDSLMRRLSKKAAGRLLDGALHDQYPAVPV